MNADPFIAAMLAGRHVSRRDNAELLAWSRQQWELWLQDQRSPTLDMFRPRLVAVAELSCLDDLQLHVGLMQLVGMASIRCAVVLSLQTEGMARIVRAQARREGWHELVSVVARADCLHLLQQLPGLAPLVVFPIPKKLAPSARQLVVDLCEESPAAGASPELRDFSWFVGRAGDYSQWREAAEPNSLGTMATVMSLISSQDPGELMLADDGVFPSAEGRMTRPLEANWNGTIHPLRGRVDLPPLGPENELVVEAIRNGAEREVIARHPGELRGHDQAVRIRMPASFLTTDPQRLRLECRDANGTATGTDLLFHVPPSHLQPWMLSAFLNRGGGGNPVIRAFAQGVACRIAYAEDEPVALRDIPVVWGVLRDSDRILAQAKAQGLYFFYIDHAYFNRGHGKTYRITRNRYEAGPIRDCPSDRIASQDVDIQPWRKGGREIVVCPPTDYFMKAHDCSDWLETTLESLRNFTDRPVTVRLKPQPGEESAPLPKALETAHAVVTHSSNVAIEAACLGTPVFVAPASAAAPIGRTDLKLIESPAYPDREPWLAHLAYNQFSYEEIKTGQAWRMLMEMEERDLV